MMGLAWAFFKRDAIVALSYRTAFVAQLLGNVLLLVIFYFIGGLISAGDSPALAPYGGSYLAFLLIGLALADCVGVSLTTFAAQIREGQLTGTLEATLMSRVPLPLILIYSSLWGYFFSALRFVLYLVVGAYLYGVNIGHANLPTAAAIFGLTVVCFAGVGIAWAAVVMLIKRGEAVLTIVSVAVILLSGVLFPREVLPPVFQAIGEVVPLTPALDGMRAAILRGDGVTTLGPVLLRLGLFAAVFMALGLLAFGRAVGLAKERGSLLEY
jgi:ABC-2 type transport system permease protein